MTGRTPALREATVFTTVFTIGQLDLHNPPTRLLAPRWPLIHDGSLLVMLFTIIR